MTLSGVKNPSATIMEEDKNLVRLKMYLSLLKSVDIITLAILTSLHLTCY